MSTLDAIDIAYLELERPLVVLSVPDDSTAAARQRFLDSMAMITESAIVLLPRGYDVRVVGPCFSRGEPAELARWADDGGRV